MIGCLLWTGCGALNHDAPAERSVAVEVLYKGTQCRAATAGAAWIERPQNLPSALQRSGGYQWDTDREGALWITMGSQPTGGYGLQLANAVASVRKAVATIQVAWQQPAPGSFVTQAFTSPCLLLKVPRTGIETIRIVDQQGRLRLSVDLP